MCVVPVYKKIRQGVTVIYDLQKASMSKRISAALFDLILLCILAVGFALVLSTVLSYDAQLDALDDIKTAYEKEYTVNAAEYEVNLEISATEYEALSTEQKEAYQNAYNAFAADDTANYLSAKLLNLSLLITSFAILFSYLAMEFAVPLLFGNGQTLGKKIFGVAVMREDSVKISPVILFVRTILGKYAVETMIPVFVVIMILLDAMGAVGIITIGGLWILQMVFVLTSKTNAAIHDRLAHTVCIDLASQKIFDTPEQMRAYRERIHAEDGATEK